MVPFSYYAFQTAVYLFIFELEKTLLSVTCQDPKLQEIKYKAFKIKRFSALFIMTYCFCLMTMWNFADEDYWTLSELEKNLILL